MPELFCELAETSFVVDLMELASPQHRVVMGMPGHRTTATLWNQMTSRPPTPSVPVDGQRPIPNAAHCLVCHHEWHRPRDCGCPLYRGYVRGTIGQTHASPGCRNVRIQTLGGVDRDVAPARVTPGWIRLCQKGASAETTRAIRKRCRGFCGTRADLTRPGVGRRTRSDVRRRLRWTLPIAILGFSGTLDYAWGEPKGQSGDTPALPMIRSSAPLVVYASRLDEALRDIRNFAGMASHLQPFGATRQSVFSDSFSSIRTEVLRYLDLAHKPNTGIDVGAHAWLSVGAQGTTLLVSLGLRDPVRFKRTLQEWAKDALQTASVGEKTAYVLGAASDQPVACILTGARATCQIGVWAHHDPLRTLRLATQRSAAGKKPRNLTEAQFYAHTKKAGLTFVLQTKPAVDYLRQRHQRHVSRVRRFDPTLRQNRRLEQTTRALADLAEYAKTAPAVVVSLRKQPRRSRLEADLITTQLGRRLIAAFLPSTPGDPRIHRWVNTTALAGLLVHVPPKHLQKGVQSLGLNLPHSDWAGTLGFLVFGVDPRCEPAQVHQPAGPLHWFTMFPSAITAALAPQTHEIKLMAEWDRFLSKTSAALSKSPQAWRRTEPLSRRRHRPFEALMTDGILIVGAGPGSSAAAKRRIAPESERYAIAGRNHETKGTPPTTDIRTEIPWAQAFVDPPAINAAFASGSFGQCHPKELLFLERLRLRLKPLLRDVRRAVLTLERPAGRTIRAQVQIEH